MRVSIIQMNVGVDKAANMRNAESLIDAAVAADAPDMVVLPEMFVHRGMDDDDRRQAAEPIPDGPTYVFLQGLARKHGLLVHGGSLPERDDGKVYNTTVAFGRDGAELARYRKIHLFDVTMPDGRELRESAVHSRGGDIVTYDAEGMRIGCSICYDLRFPELYQALAKAGADIIMIPAAFTKVTGQAHWEPLMRARAIETETYVVAPAQSGPYPNKTGATYGHSVIVDPWGKVIAHIADTESNGFATAEIDPAYVATVRARIPVARHKVL